MFAENTEIRSFLVHAHAVCTRLSFVPPHRAWVRGYTTGLSNIPYNMEEGGAVRHIPRLNLVCCVGEREREPGIQW